MPRIAVGAVTLTNVKDGLRGSVHISHEVSGKSWKNTTEGGLPLPSLFPNSILVVGDRLTQVYKGASSAPRSQTKYWDGAKWVVVAQIIDGNLLVAGSVRADAVDTDDLYSRNVTVTGAITLNGDDFSTELRGSGASPFMIKKGGKEVFGVTQKNGTNVLKFDGQLEPGIIADLSAFSQDVLDVLAPPVAGSTGGNKALNAAASLPKDKSTHTETLAISECNQNNVTISVAMRDTQGVQMEQDVADPLPPPPEWRILVDRYINDVHSDLILNEQVRGSVTSMPGRDYYRDPYDGQEYGNVEVEWGLSVSKSFKDEELALDGVQEGDKLSYRLRIYQVSGPVYAPSLTAYIISQPTAGGGTAGAASTLQHNGGHQTGDYFLDYRNFTHLPSEFPAAAHDASKVTSGVLSDARIPSLSASKVTSGVFLAARIPNLSASKVNAGVFDLARIPDLTIAKVSGLQAKLDAKAPTHTHPYLQLSGGTLSGGLEVPAGPLTGLSLNGAAYIGASNNGRTVWYASDDRDETKNGWLWRTLRGGGGRLDVATLSIHGTMWTYGQGTLYGTSNKPSAADLGAAAASHDHGRINHDSYNYLDLKHHGNHAWLRNQVGTWTFQGEAVGDDWTRAISLFLPTAGTVSNAMWAELGQRLSNESDGRYRGVRIVKTQGGVIRDGDLRVGQILLKSQGAHSGATITASDGGTYGTNLVVKTGGNAVISAGETTADYAVPAGSSNEDLHLGADANVYIYAGANTWGSRKTATFNTSGVFTVPSLTVQSNISVTGDLKMAGTDSYIWTPAPADGMTGLWDQPNSRKVWTYKNSEGKTRFHLPVIAEGNLTAAGVTLSSGYYNNHSGDSYDKVRVFSSSLYTIGMRSGMTHGWLNDWSMTFTMNNDTDRGFVWRHNEMGRDEAAMSLTTAGQLNVKDSIGFGGSTTDYLHRDTSYLRWSNGYGYIKIGTGNTSHAHIVTDRSNFYFNKELRVDTGIIGSYDEDLQLRRAGTTKIRAKTSEVDFADRRIQLGGKGLLKNQDDLGGVTWITNKADTDSSHKGLGVSNNEGPVYWDGGARKKVLHEGHPGHFAQTYMITVGGDANTYYPVVISGEGTTMAFRRVHFSRRYNWTAPSTWNNSTHKGGLTLGILWSGDGAWGGNDKTLVVEQFNETYSNMVAGLALRKKGLTVWLRGGGAHYAINADWLNPSIAVYLSGFTDSDGAAIDPVTDTSRVTSDIRRRWTRRGNYLYDDNNRVYSASNRPKWADVHTDRKPAIDYRDSTYQVEFDSPVHGNNKPLHYLSELHFNSNTRFTNKDASYLTFKWGDSGDGGMQFFNGAGVKQGYLYGDGAATPSFGILSADGSWGLRVKDGYNYFYHSVGLYDGGSIDMYGGVIHRRAHSAGYLVGGYNSVGENSYKTNPIFTIGTSYMPSDTGLNDMYGIGYTHNNAPFINSSDLGTTPTGWGLYVAADGNARIYLDASYGDGHFKRNVYAGQVLSRTDIYEKGSSLANRYLGKTAKAADSEMVDGYDSSRLYRRTGSAEATVGPGWVTVAQCTSSRFHGEVVVTDGDSGDHSFIRIHWMRSYNDSNFTVLNVGGHANRITGVRVLKDSNTTYGVKKLQVYVTVSSRYYVRIMTLGDTPAYGSLSVVTPVVQNSISGYSLQGRSVEELNIASMATSQGIVSGEQIKARSYFGAMSRVLTFDDMSRDDAPAGIDVTKIKGWLDVDVLSASIANMNFANIKGKVTAGQIDATNLNVTDANFGDKVKIDGDASDTQFGIGKTALLLTDTFGTGSGQQNLGVRMRNKSHGIRVVGDMSSSHNGLNLGLTNKTTSVDAYALYVSAGGARGRAAIFRGDGYFTNNKGVITVEAGRTSDTAINTYGVIRENGKRVWSESYNPGPQVMRLGALVNTGQLTLLYSSSSGATGSLTLSQAYTNFNALLVLGMKDSWQKWEIVPTDAFAEANAKGHDLMLVSTASMYWRVDLSNSNTTFIDCYNRSGVILKVWGIK